MVRLALAPLFAALVCHLAACEPNNPSSEAEKSWTMVYEELPAALLSTWGSGADDVFFVGADPSDGHGPWVFHWDGEAMERLQTGATGNLWWVSGTSASGPIYLAGGGGLALRYDRDGTFTPLTGVPSDVTLFGIFAVPGGRVWAVGGQRSTGKVYVLDGTTFSEATDLPADAGMNNAFNKVWGRSEDDLWVVGIGQHALHRSAAGWATVDTLGESPLFTAHGNATETIGVGGFVEGRVLRLAASGVTDVSPIGASRLNGVWVHDDGVVTAVGSFGEVWERQGGDTWHRVTIPDTVFDFHGVYAAPNGEVWAVGGQISTEPLRLGMLLHYGSQAIDPTPPE